MKDKAKIVATSCVSNSSADSTARAALVAAMKDAGGKLDKCKAGALCKKYTSTKLKALIRADGIFDISNPNFIILMNSNPPPRAHHPPYLGKVQQPSSNTACPVIQKDDLAATTAAAANNGSRTLLEYKVVGPISSPHHPSFKDMLQHLSSTSTLALDCEWSGKQLCLVQLAALGPGEMQSQCVVYLLDMLGGPFSSSSSSSESHALIMLRPIRVILEGEGILKVFHDAREDVLRLGDHLAGLRVKPILDTQIAWAVHALTQVTSRGATAAGNVSNYDRQPQNDVNMQPQRLAMGRIGLGDLLECHGLIHPYKEAVKAIMRSREGVNMWIERPLEPLFVQYAADDARLLLELWRRMSLSVDSGLRVDLSLAQSLSQIQADLHQLGDEKKAAMLKLDSPAVKALTSCFGGKDAGDNSTKLRFQMKFQGDCGKGISYSLILPSSNAIQYLEDCKQGEGNDRGPEPVLDVDASSLIDLLPKRLAERLQAWKWIHPSQNRSLMEIAVDKGRPIVLRFRDGSKMIIQDGHDEVPIQSIVSSLEAARCLLLASDEQNSERGPPGGLFGKDGRLALPGSLHRISRMQDPRDNYIQGLTLRVGRHIAGASAIFADILGELASRRRKGLLLVGAPGLGKTTLLRDAIQALSDDFNKSVIVVDTSNEIAGDGNPPHSCIGSARRMMVGNRDNQYNVLLEAVQNHTPEVLVVDEIGTKPEVAAIRTIAERGVTMVATAHGSDMSSLLSNPELVILLGGLEAVTLGDAAAAKDNNHRKTRLERKGLPVFDTVVEVIGQGQWRLHRDVGGSVDSMLGGGKGNAEVREYGSILDDGQRQMIVRFETTHAAQLAAAAASRGKMSTGSGPSYAEVAGSSGDVQITAGSWILDLIQSAVTLGATL